MIFWLEACRKGEKVPLKVTWNLDSETVVIRFLYFSGKHNYRKMHNFVNMFSNNFVLSYMKTLRWHALIIFCNFFFFTKRHLLIFSYSSSTCCLFVTIPDLLCTGHCHSQWRGTTKSQVELEGMENLPSADCIIPSESEWFVMFPVWSMKIYIILSYLYC